MQIAGAEERNHLYDIIADMGLVISPSKAIEMARANCPMYRTIPLLDDDLNRLSWYGKHFMIHKREQTGSEVWIGNEYINEKRLHWETHMTNPNIIFGITYDEPRKDDHEIRFCSNENVLFRVSKYEPEHTEMQIYTHNMKLSELPEDLDLDNCFYYITQNKYFKPVIEYHKDYISIICTYVVDLDLFCATNLQWCGNVDAGIGFLVDDVLEKRVYTKIILNNDDQYPIDARFYPWLCVDKACFIRVYKDTYMHVKNPLTCRLINYEEFAFVEDPYNTDIDYLNNFKPSDIIVDASDTDDELYQQFEAMIGEWYRCFDNYHMYSHDSVFHLYENTQYEKQFVHINIYITGNNAKKVIASQFPFDASRDILFYNGEMYRDYKSSVLHQLDDDTYEYAPEGYDGKPVYILEDDTLDLDKLCVVKLTASGENTTWKNVEYYLDKDNLIHLHKKINKFYRNVAVLEDAIYTIGDLGDKVWIGVNEPDVMDENLWIEILSVADEDVVKALANRIPDSVTGLLPESLMEKMASPITQEEIETKLKNLHMDQNITIDEMDHHDVWIEWLDTVRDFVHFSSENSMIIRVNDHIYSVELDLDAEEDQSELYVYAFDDIVLNYRDNWYGVRYLSLLADLYRSNVVTESELTIFYKRLLTSVDSCKLNLNRVKDYTSSVVTEMKRPDEDDLVVLYSTNLGRMQFVPENFTEEERTMILTNFVIPYENISDFAYDEDRVLIFLNGKLIHRKNIIEERPFYLKILGFNELVETIDIMYNIIDIPVMKLKRIAMKALLNPPELELETYDPRINMEKIDMHDITYAGYYDVMYRDYMGNLRKILDYFIDHPDEFEDFKKDFLQDFAQVTSKKGLADVTGDNRIILWGSLESRKYYLEPVYEIDDE